MLELFVITILSQQIGVIFASNGQNRSLPVVMWHGMGKIFLFGHYLCTLTENLKYSVHTKFNLLSFGQAIRVASLSA